MIIRAIAAVLISLGPLVPFYFRPVTQVADVWPVLVLAILFLEHTFYADSLNKALIPRTSMTALVVTTLLQLAILRPQVIAPPAGWNYHLYTGALWARENLPPDATIWADSAGILGYFSERTVVNTDGLANDYGFLENVLKAGPEAKAQYLRQWDYGIDAFPYPSSNLLPEGCFVPLPEGFQPAPFSDDTSVVRRLQVYQMSQEGIITCPDSN